MNVWNDAFKRRLSSYEIDICNGCAKRWQNSPVPNIAGKNALDFE